MAILVLLGAPLLWVLVARYVSMASLLWIQVLCYLNLMWAEFGELVVGEEEMEL